MKHATVSTIVIQPQEIAVHSFSYKTLKISDGRVGKCMWSISDHQSPSTLWCGQAVIYIKMNARGETHGGECTVLISTPALEELLKSNLPASLSWANRCDFSMEDLMIQIWIWTTDLLWGEKNMPKEDSWIATRHCLLQSSKQSRSEKGCGSIHTVNKIFCFQPQSEVWNCPFVSNWVLQWALILRMRHVDTAVTVIHLCDKRLWSFESVCLKNLTNPPARSWTLLWGNLWVTRSIEPIWKSHSLTQWTHIKSSTLTKDYLTARLWCGLTKQIIRLDYNSLRESLDR